MIYCRRIIMPVCLAALTFFQVGGCSEKKQTFHCDDPIGCVTLAPGEKLKLGVLQALSGKVASLGNDQVRGMELALDDLDGRVLGHPVDLQVEDTGCSGEGGANATLKIIADPDVVAIFGTTCSGAARTASRAMSRAGLLMVSGNNSASFLTSINEEKAPDWQEGYFRVSNNEEHMGRVAAMYAVQVLGLKKAAVIHEGSIYSRGLAEGFSRSFRQLGGHAAQMLEINKGEKQMGPVLTDVEQAGAELLFFPVYQPEGNQIVRQAKARQGMKDVILMSGGALVEQTFIDDVMDLGTGMYFVGPSRISGPRVDELDRRYEGHYGEASPTGYYLYGYDASHLLFKAIDRAAVRGGDGTVHIGRKALRQAMYAMKGVEGVTGTLHCDEFGDCSTPRFTVFRLDDPAAGVSGLKANTMKRYVFE